MAEKKTPRKKTTTKKRTPAKKTGAKKKTTAKKKPTKRVSAAQREALAIAQRQWVMALVALFIAFILLLSYLSPDEGVITGFVESVFRKGFGWGQYFIPFFFGAYGLYLLAQRFGQTVFVSRVKVGALIGLFISFEALSTNYLLSGQSTDPLTPKFTVWDLAQDGRGGGYFGGIFAHLLNLLVGQAGSFFLYAVIGIISLCLLAGINRGMIVRAVLYVKTTIQEMFVTRPSKSTVFEDGQDVYQNPIYTQEVIAEQQPQKPRSTRRRKQPQQPVPVQQETHLQDAQDADAIRARRRKQLEAMASGSRKKRASKKEKTEQKDNSPQSLPYTSAPQGQWTRPSVYEMLESGISPETNDEYLAEQADIIIQTLESFGAPARIVDMNSGPTVTQFGVEPGYVVTRGGEKRTKVKVSKIAGLADDLALALAAKSVRIQAPVPGKGYIGIEVPSTNKVIVSLRDIMESQSFLKMKNKPLRLGFGQDVAGNAVSADLAKMPHLLIAGATGSGKSVCVNSIIACLLLNNTPDELRFVMIDPKRVELTGYNGIPHLASPVVVEMDRVIGVLQWALREMDRRYQTFAKVGARNIISYNDKMAKTGGDKLPYIVIIVDELADLMMTAPEETERALARLAQMARATGMHMILATQRPSVDVVRGLIKANFPARIAFAVSSSTDSRVVLDTTGAERLLGMGDMLFQKPDSPSPQRMQGCYVGDDELDKIIRYWKTARRFQEIAHEDAVQTVPSHPTENPIHATKPDLSPSIQKRMRSEREVPFDPEFDPPSFPPRRTPVQPSTPIDSAPAPIQPTETVPFTPPVVEDEPSSAPWDDVIVEFEAAEEDLDELWPEVLTFIKEKGMASTSLLQRRFRIGYTRSARIMDALEDKRFIGPPTGTSKAREVLLPSDE